MLIDVLNKVFFVLFFMSCLNVIRHTYYFIQAWFKSSSESPQKYILPSMSLWILSASIAYILATIFNGLLI